jgi:outer membrane protein assembly factor BamD
MYRRIAASIALGLALVLIAGCHHAKVVNPIANVNSKQPDKVLFDRAMEAMKKGKYDVARITLQTLINTYPDSEYVARAKLSVADSWYAEGGATGLQQAEIEYKDFITFFPNMAEAAEAQLKVANIHYRQMEKPDRDYTHAKRAEDEYRTLMQQFPDSKLVPDAKEKLRQVQEVLAEREYRIGRFYFLRESWAASIARLKSVTDTYPLYSKADDALMMLGESYERQIDAIRASKIPEDAKGRYINTLKAHAAESYNRVITRYPVGGLADRAQARLEALHMPVPKATPEAIALNKSEEDSRGRTGRLGKLMLNFHRGPDMATATKVGDPTMSDPAQTSAPELVQQANQEMVRDITGATAAGPSGASVEVVGKGAPPPNQAAPRSDTAPAATGEPPAGAQPAATGTAAPPANASPAARPAQPDNSGIEDLATPGNAQPANTAPAVPPSAQPANAPPAAQPNAQPAVPPAAPSASAPAPPIAPTQVNDANSQADPAQASSSSDDDKNTKDSSSLKKKKKKKTKDQQ